MIANLDIYVKWYFGTFIDSWRATTARRRAKVMVFLGTPVEIGGNAA
jgi:hypothetical protein